jgi:hypothetical protein
MNKSEQTEVIKLYSYSRLGFHDIVARTQRSRHALMSQADILEVTHHPEFIV